MNVVVTWMKGLAVAAACLLLTVPRLPAASPSDQKLQEYDVKAAFLYNFASFVEWPTAAFARPDSPFVIGVLGNDPFGTILDELVKGEQVGSHPLILHRFNRVEDMNRCHILFISASEARRTKEILRKLKGQSVLTVADIPGFAEGGGMIGFTADTRVSIVMNQAALQAAKLTVSAKLLRLAHLVTEGNIAR